MKGKLTEERSSMTFKGCNIRPTQVQKRTKVVIFFKNFPRQKELKWERGVLEIEN